MTTTTQTSSFTKLRNGSWGIKGYGLKAGQQATVCKRSGEQSTVTVDRVLWTGDDGLQIASIRREQSTRTHRQARSNNWSVRRQFVNGICQMCGCESWDCDC